MGLDSVRMMSYRVDLLRQKQEVLIGMRSRSCKVDFNPRPQQEEIIGGMRENRWGAVVAHRRLGKTVCAVNLLIDAALNTEKSAARYAYAAPTYRMAKSIAWDYIKAYAGQIAGTRFNESELRADFLNGARIRLFGMEEAQKHRGIYLDGIVLDEFGLMGASGFNEVIRPALSDREGFALFMGTPAGKNAFYDVCMFAKRAKNWFHGRYPVSETKLIPEEELIELRKIMTEDEYLQEFECSFEAAIKGAYYGKLIQDLERNGRITSVPIDPRLPVHCGLDIGIQDQTVLWFFQILPSGEPRFVDYYAMAAEPLVHYVNVMRSKAAEHKYVSGEVICPPDISIREYGSGRSRIEIMRSLGINPIVARHLPIQDGIEAVKAMLPMSWFDGKKCEDGITALKNYRRQFDQKRQRFIDAPYHDWASDPADCLRYIALHIESLRGKVRNIRDAYKRSDQRRSSWMSSL